MPDHSRLQVELDQETLAVLDARMVAVRRAEQNRKIGAGTIAARLLESLAIHPDLIDQLLAEYARQAGPVAQAFDEDETSGVRHPQGKPARRG